MVKSTADILEILSQNIHFIKKKESTQYENVHFLEKSNCLKIIILKTNAASGLSG